ncbi:MAG: cyclic nucleotide-binding domain-containing protein, partial [Cyanobacteria bacterium J06638_6]
MEPVNAPSYGLPADSLAPVDDPLIDADGNSLIADIAISPQCNIRLFGAGEMVFSEGSPADKAYIIESGYVEIFVGIGDGIVQLNMLGPGDIFGEMGIVDASPRLASA